MVQQYRTSDVTLVPGQKICSGCRIKLIQRQIPLNSIDEVDMGTSWEPRSSGSDDGDERDLSTDLSSLLVSLGQSPIDRTKLGRKRYCEDKVKENEQGIRKKLKLEPSKEEQEYQELLEQLKKFGDSSTRSEKLQVLVSFLSPGQYKELKRSLGQLFTWQGYPSNWCLLKEYCRHQILDLVRHSMQGQYSLSQTFTRVMGSVA